MFLIQKYTQYKAAQAEQQKRKVKVTEKELSQLNQKIDKLLSKLDEHEPEIAENQDDECVVCVNAKATMQTYPCGHRVVCRKCFVKTIQMAVSQRLLPLRCVLCRAKILRLKHANAGPLPTSTSQHTLSTPWYHRVPQSSSLYSVSSTVSGMSGISGVSSASSCSASSYKTCTSSFSSASLKKRTYSKQGYKPLRTSSPSPSRSPSGRTVRSAPAKPPSAQNKEEEQKGKEDSKETSSSTPATPTQNLPPKGKLSLIQEFQREFRNGKSRSVNERKSSSAGSCKSGSTRVKCARSLLSQAHPGGTATSETRLNGKTSSSSGNDGANVGFRRPAPPTSSQSCHSFRLTRHDSVAPVTSSKGFKKGSLQTIPDEQFESDAKYVPLPVSLKRGED